MLANAVIDKNTRSVEYATETFNAVIGDGKLIEFNGNSSTTDVSPICLPMPAWKFPYYLDGWK
ncbi:MAG: hypothetical protein IJW92_02270 [Clostridia bacterium]|nr:hypothetical protein [Clostridia bacterium]